MTDHSRQPIANRSLPQDGAGDQPKTPTVRDEWGLACPKCGSDEHILIAISTMLELHPDGTHIDDDHEWGPFSHCVCSSCGYEGRVAHFDTTGGGPCR